jgi:protein phosphatase
VSIWRYAASSDVGLIRDLNEDAVFVDGALAVVADGMGGHAAGEVASEIAVATVVRGFAEDPTRDGLVSSLRDANVAILQDAVEHPERTGMGTTMVALGLVRSGDGTMPVVANIGDSRAYQLRDGALRQITADHSVAEEWVRQGRLTPLEASTHPRRHQLTRTLGMEGVADVDVFPLNVQVGDRILLCSDGLSNELSESELAEIASPPHSLDEAVVRLVQAANERGGRDNISVVLLEFDEPVLTPAAGVVAAAAAQVAIPAAPRKVSRVKHQPRFTWRTAVFVVALVGVLAAAYFTLEWYANSSYYLAVGVNVPANEQQIFIYQGQPHGLLWFKPSFVLNTQIPVNALLPPDQAAVAATISEPSLAAAITYANELKIHAQLANPTSTTTTLTLRH